MENSKCINILERIKYFESDANKNKGTKKEAKVTKLIKINYKSKNNNDLDKQTNMLVNNSANNEQTKIEAATILQKELVPIKMNPSNPENRSKIPKRILNTYHNSQLKKSFNSNKGDYNNNQDKKIEETKSNSSTWKFDNSEIITDEKEINCTNSNVMDAAEIWKKQFHFFESIQAMENEEMEIGCSFSDFIMVTESNDVENNSNDAGSNSEYNFEHCTDENVNACLDEEVNNNCETVKAIVDEKELTNIEFTKSGDVDVYSSANSLEIFGNTNNEIANYESEDSNATECYEEILEDDTTINEKVNSHKEQTTLLKKVLLPEQDYLAILKNVYILYEKSKPHFHLETIRCTFGEIEELLDFHQKFYKDLKNCKNIRKLGELFMTRKCSFDVYIRDKWKKTRQSSLSESIFVPHHNWTNKQLQQYEHILKQLYDYSKVETIKCALYLITELKKQCEEINWLKLVKNCPVINAAGKFLSKEQFTISCGSRHFGMAFVILMEEYIICIQLKNKTCFAYKPIAAIKLPVLDKKKIIIEETDNSRHSQLILKCNNVDNLTEWYNAIEYLVRKLKK